jgi:Flp pilus assembly protein TadD
LLDRARAAEAQNDLKTARAKLTEAAATVSDDPFYWYFSAAVAIRELDKATAQTAIGRALSLAPADPIILFEAGHVAHFAGDDVKARDYWTRAAAADPTGPAGKEASNALAILPAPLTEKLTPPAP